MVSAGCRLVGVVALGAWLAGAGLAEAQMGRVSGVVRDEGGDPIKGATVTAENPTAAPSTFTASTDDRGRFAVLGLRSGTWILTAEAPGYVPSQGTTRVQTIGSNPALEFRLVRGAAPAPEGALAGVNVRDLQADLDRAEELFAQGDYEGAIGTYRGILARTPGLTIVNLQIGHAHVRRGEFELAVAAYEEVLKGDPANERARVAIAQVHLERRDLRRAAAVLETAVGQQGAGREVFYALGEVRLAMGDPSDAMGWFRKASDADPFWGKPLWRLAENAMQEGDRDAAERLMARVVSVDPASPEAEQARATLDQLAATEC